MCTNDSMKDEARQLGMFYRLDEKAPLQEKGKVLESAGQSPIPVCRNCRRSRIIPKEVLIVRGWQSVDKVSA